jgi:GPH family glycoside/pentoside/hexuronide:cation symporter
LELAIELEQAPALTRFNKIAYAVGGVPALIEQRGLSAFLLIFYNQVVGLPPYLVTSALLITAIFDAFCDPVVGQISDNFRSRWGRRHPFIYASIVPLSLGYFLIWWPPLNWSQTMLFAYLLGMLLIVRVADSCYELPSSALLPELTPDYNERTGILSLRTLFALIGGMSMSMLALRVFLRESSNGAGGVLARQGYFGYGLASALIIAVTILISAVGTQGRIPYLSKPRRRSVTLKAMLGEVAATISNRSLLALIVTGILMSICNGAKAGLEIYFGLYFWELEQSQLATLVVASLIGIFAGVALAPPLARRFGKRPAAVMVIVAGIIGNGGPVFARLFGVMPPNHTQALFVILFADVAFTFCVATATTILMTSMLNDVVEDVEVKTGRRSEGLLLAADTLCRKLVSSLGIFIAGLILTLIGFPRKAARGSVPPELVGKLAYAYVVMTVLYTIALCILYFYRIDRTVHERNLRALLNRRGNEHETVRSVYGSESSSRENLSR